MGYLISSCMQKHTKPAYRPAALVEGLKRWYILVYQQGQRLRLTYDLNRIKEVALRRARARVLVDLLNWWMQAGLTVQRFDEAEAQRRRAEAQARGIAPRGHVPLSQALEAALKVKTAGSPEDTTKSYRSVAKLFSAYLVANGWEAMPADQLQRHHVMGYADHCRVDRKASNTTINNNIAILNGMCVWLVDRGYCVVNPCEQIKKLPKEAKRRRSFTRAEAQTVAAYIRDTDSVLYLALLLEYTCYLRPKEIRLLRVSDIDTSTGVVLVRRASGKSGKLTGDRRPTAPTAVLDLLRGLVPAGAAQSYYLFGEAGSPAAKPCGHSFFYKRHLAALKKLEAAGELSSIVGLTWYSWKDTGITEALENMPLLAVQDQAGHTSPDMTLRYRAKPSTSAAMKAWVPDALRTKDDAEPGQG